MSEKQKNIWQAAVLSIVELIFIVTLCCLNAHSFSFGFGGERVAALQKMLKQNGAYTGEINGLFDIETKNAIKELFPESAGEANYYVLERLGLNCDCCGFSALSEITARYFHYKSADICVCEIRKILNENNLSNLMRCDYDFFCKIKKLNPSSEACDCAYKFENNK